MKRKMYSIVVVALLHGAVVSQTQREVLFPERRPLLKNGLFLHAPVITMQRPSLFVKYELPQAVFCRMEEKLWQKFNVWIKLRAGNDEMYMKLLRGN